MKYDGVSQSRRTKTGKAPKDCENQSGLGCFQHSQLMSNSDVGCCLEISSHSDSAQLQTPQTVELEISIQESIEISEHQAEAAGAGVPFSAEEAGAGCASSDSCSPDWSSRHLLQGLFLGDNLLGHRPECGPGLVKQHVPRMTTAVLRPAPRTRIWPSWGGPSRCTLTP